MSRFKLREIQKFHDCFCDNCEHHYGKPCMLFVALALTNCERHDAAIELIFPTLDDCPLHEPRETEGETK